MAVGASAFAKTDGMIPVDGNYDPVATADEASFYMEPMVVTDGGWRVRIRYPDGEVRLDAEYSASEFGSGRWVGDFAEYHPDGAPRETGRYNARGERDGELHHYLADGTLLYVSRYRHGRRHGEQELFHDNGQPRRTVHYEDGAITDGEVRSYDKQGYLSGVMRYRNGKRHGVAESYHPDGGIGSRTSYEQGQLHGVAERFYESGALNRRTSYVNGKRHGESLLFTEGGHLVGRTVYREGERHGEATAYRESGRKARRREYDMGTPVGIHRHWYRDGKPRSLYEYDADGQLIDERRYDTAGRIVSRKWKVQTPHGPGWRQETWREGRLRSRSEHDEERNWTLREGFDDAGRLHARRERLDGKSQGEHREERWDGALTIMHFLDDELHGEYIIRKDGRILEQGTYRHGRKVGAWLVEDVDGVASETYDDQERLQGERRVEAADGTVLLRENYRDGELHGRYEKRHSAGDQGGREFVARGRYHKGKRVGAWMIPGARPGMRAEGHYENGRHVGRWRTFDAHGYVREIVPFGSDGVQHGRIYVFGENGALLSHQDVRAGVRHGDTVYYEDGVPDHLVCDECGEEAPPLDDDAS